MHEYSSIPASVRTGQSHLDVVTRLQSLIDAALEPSLPALRSKPFSLLDMPNHSNVGDSAIWAGEMAWLRRNVKSPPSYVCDHNASNGELRDNLAGSGVILLHGGGNFGDVWPEHQNFRERIISCNPDSTIVQLPQSIHFSDEAALVRTTAVLRNAPQLQLLVRDAESYDLASNHFGCEVKLCPDMAFALGPLRRSVSPDLHVLLLLRTDKESGLDRSTVKGLPEFWEQADWLDDDPKMHSRALLGSRFSAVISLNVDKLSKVSRRKDYYERVSTERLERGMRLLSRANFVITDRLHVHIISTLMGIPHCFLDNSYGKIARFSKSFDTRWNDSYQATSLADAVACAKNWLGQSKL